MRHLPSIPTAADYLLSNEAAADLTFSLIKKFVCQLSVSSENVWIVEREKSLFCHAASSRSDRPNYDNAVRRGRSVHRYGRRGAYLPRRQCAVWDGPAQLRCLIGQGQMERSAQCHRSEDLLPRSNGSRPGLDRLVGRSRNVRKSCRYMSSDGVAVPRSLPVAERTPCWNPGDAASIVSRLRRRQPPRTDLESGSRCPRSGYLVNMTEGTCRRVRFQRNAERQAYRQSGARYLGTRADLGRPLF